jgi:hypothetical protein
LEEENRGDHGEETSQIAIGRRHQKWETLLATGHSITNDFAKRYNRFLSHNINILNVLILCWLKAAQSAQQRVKSHNWPASCRVFTTGLSLFSLCTFFRYKKADGLTMLWVPGLNSNQLIDTKDIFTCVDAC